jgi:hypothetical protein
MGTRADADVNQGPGPDHRRDQPGEPGHSRVVQQVEGVSAGHEDQPRAKRHQICLLHAPQVFTAAIKIAVNGGGVRFARDQNRSLTVW